MSDTIVKEEKKLSIKRLHEEDDQIISHNTNNKHEIISNNSNQQVIKKVKGFGIPNWKNIKDSTTAVRRYQDHELLRIFNSCREMIRDRERRLLSIPIYTISVNVLCKLKKDASFIPLEFGIHSYGLGKGRTKAPYHVLINAGQLPAGHLSIATDHSQYHKITFPPKDKSYPVQARNDYKVIYKEMLDYTKEGERTVLIRSLREMNQVTKSLEWLWEKSCEEGARLPKVSTWTILPMKEYLLAMHNWVSLEMLKGVENSFLISYWVDSLLERDQYQYDDKIRCDYHKLEEYETEWCAKSCATRMIMNVELLVDEIYKMYKFVTTTPAPQQLAIQAPPQPAIQGPQSAVEQQQNLSTSHTTIAGGTQRPLPITNNQVL